jgi:hypothetical protein
MGRRAEELRIADWLAPFLSTASASPGRLGGLRIEFAQPDHRPSKRGLFGGSELRTDSGVEERCSSGRHFFDEPTVDS